MSSSGSSRPCPAMEARPAALTGSLSRTLSVLLLSGGAIAGCGPIGRDVPSRSAAGDDSAAVVGAPTGFGLATVRSSAARERAAGAPADAGNVIATGSTTGGVQPDSIVVAVTAASGIGPAISAGAGASTEASTGASADGSLTTGGFAAGADSTETGSTGTTGGSGATGATEMSTGVTASAGSAAGFGSGTSGGGGTGCGTSSGSRPSGSR